MHGEELRCGDPGQAGHARPDAGGVEGDHVAGDLAPRASGARKWDNRGPAIEEFAVSHDVFPALSSQQRSLTRFLIEEQRAGHVNPELRLLIEVVARACKRISVAVGKGALGGVLGDAEGGDGGSNINVQGEAQKKDRKSTRLNSR